MNKEINDYLEHEKILKFIIETAPTKMRRKIFLTNELNETMREIEKRSSIRNEVFTKIFAKSFLSALLLICIVIFSLSNTEIFGKHIEKFFTASVGIFVAFFAYNYTLFNNQWKYTADLYNKIYFDLSFDSDPVAIFRKRCLLAQDILLQKLEYHASFETELNQIVVLAAYFCYEFKLVENFQLEEDFKNKFVKFNFSAETVLTECIIACENAEIRNYSANQKNEYFKNQNVPINLINQLLNKIDQNKLSIDQSKKLLLKTKDILANSDKDDAYQNAKTYIDNFEESA